jgi:hypothetical protein
MGGQEDVAGGAVKDVLEDESVEELEEDTVIVMGVQEVWEVLDVDERGEVGEQVLAYTVDVVVVVVVVVGEQLDCVELSELVGEHELA